MKILSSKFCRRIVLPTLTAMAIMQSASANYTETYYAACRIAHNRTYISIIATPFSYTPEKAARIETESCDSFFVGDSTKFDCRNAIETMKDVLQQYKATKLCP